MAFIQNLSTDVLMKNDPHNKKDAPADTTEEEAVTLDSPSTDESPDQTQIDRTIPSN